MGYCAVLLAELAAVEEGAELPTVPRLPDRRMSDPFFVEYPF